MPNKAPHKKILNVLNIVAPGLPRCKIPKSIDDIIKAMTMAYFELIALILNPSAIFVKW